MLKNINHTFLLERKIFLNDKAIYYRKLKEPLLLGKEKCISHLSISGYRNWMSDYEESVIKETVNSQNFEILIQRKMTTTTTTTAAPIEKIQISPQIFFLNDFEKSFKILKSKIVEKISLENLSLYILKDNIFFFKILSNDISIGFSHTLCDYFGFKRDALYDSQCLVNYFVHHTHFFDEKCNSIGVQANFGFNPGLGKDCVAFLFVKNIPCGSYFQEVLISCKQNLKIKFDILEEIEIRFLDLSTNKIFKSLSYQQPDYIQLDICFT